MILLNLTSVLYNHFDLKRLVFNWVPDGNIFETCVAEVIANIRLIVEEDVFLLEAQVLIKTPRKRLRIHNDLFKSINLVIVHATTVVIRVTYLLLGHFMYFIAKLLQNFQSPPDTHLNLQIRVDHGIVDDRFYLHIRKLVAQK